jgi:hypothetical protein
MGLVENAERLTDAVARLVEQEQPVASRLVRVHQYYWLRLWMESGGCSLPETARGVEDHVFMVGREPARD